MILVTGAAGKTGIAVTRALAGRGMAVRALVRRAEQKPSMELTGAAQVKVGDLGDRAALRQAVAGVAAIYHICPNVDPLEREYARLLIDEARAAGVGHFGYHSVLHPQTESMIHHWNKLRVEEALFESGIPYTILQPCAYMQNLLAQKASIVDDGVITVPYSVEAKFSFVDLGDVAEAAAVVMSEREHRWAIYELAGPEALDHLQIATMVQTILGKPVRAQQISVGAWASSARKNDLGKYRVDALTAMFEYYDRHGLRGNPESLAHLIGRQPRSFGDFLQGMLPA
jgi:NAD(P)H dehydrogenase (quinone)